MGINRPGGLARYTAPSGVAARGANGSYTPSLAGADSNPYPNVIQGKSDLITGNDIQLVNNWLSPTAINPGPPYDDSCLFWPGTWGNDVMMVGTVGIAAGQSGTATFQELEFLFCCDVTPGCLRLYEMNIAVHPTAVYADIARWNGGTNTNAACFDIAQHTTGFAAVANGNQFKALKVGTNLSSYLDTGSGFVQLGSTIDLTTFPANAYGPNTYINGLVGVGAWQRGGVSGDLTKFGWASVTILAP